MQHIWHVTAPSTALRDTGTDNGKQEGKSVSKKNPKIRLGLINPLSLPLGFREPSCSQGSQSICSPAAGRAAHAVEVSTVHTPCVWLFTATPGRSTPLLPTEPSVVLEADSERCFQTQDQGVKREKGFADTKPAMVFL